MAGWGGGAPPPPGSFWSFYDVNPDDERFMMIRPVGGGAQSELILVQNFFEELRARVGGWGATHCARTDSGVVSSS